MGLNESFKKRNIPINVIQESVSKASNVPLPDLLASNTTPKARKREKVAARQISMTLCKEYTKSSLAMIGFHHGGHDHATVLHAHKQVNNLIDTKDPMVTDWFQESERLLHQWCVNNPIDINGMTPAQKTKLVKYWIRNRVPHFVRQRELQILNKRCAVCGHSLVNKDNYGNTIKTLPNSLQRSYKKQI